MRLNTRLGILALAVVLAAFLIGACSSAPDTPAAPAPSAPSSAAPAPAPVAPAAPAPIVEESKIGASLIGTLEGPSVVTDPNLWPTSFNEAPQFAELVAAGKLAPVAERVSQDPLVVDPVHGIGEYGGLWRRGFSGPADRWNGYRCCSGPDNILFWDFTGNTAVPNVAKEVVASADGTTFTLMLRRGMKWSDGEAFTADDFVFWYEEMYLNDELLPSKPPHFSINGKRGVVTKVDDTTVKITFPEPYFLFTDVLAGSTQVTSQSHEGRNGRGLYAPEHYLKQFHPKFNPNIDDVAKAEGFDNWVVLLKAKNDWSSNPDLPVITPWITVIPATEPTWVLERNPYSIWVDTAGNQLPYIDQVSMRLFENLEVHNLRAVAGEYDFQARHVDIQKVPVFLENEEKGQYKLHLDPGDYGGDMIIKFSLSYDEDAEIHKWFNTTDFRRALSLGIDRDQINETFWLGTATPRSVVPAASNIYFPGAKYERLWATFEPDKANQMLDAIGLDKKDSSGFRLRTDGKGPLVVRITTLGGQFVQYTQIMEAIGEQWENIGIKLDVNEVERGLAEQMSSADQHQLYSWNNDGSEHLFTFPGHVFPFDSRSTGGAKHGLWFQTNGEEGAEPPEFLQTVMSKWTKAFTVPYDERVKLGQEIWQIAADEVYTIGVVGLGAASMGVRVAKTDLGNVPSRQYNSPDGKTPGISRPVTFFWQSEGNRSHLDLIAEY